jgi:hypothetical protein
MDHLRRAFRDICVGHTTARILGRTAFIKHLNHADQVDIDERRQAFHDEGRALGLPTQDEKLAELVAAGTWSDAREAEINRARSYILELEEGKRKNANVPSMVEGYVKRIKEAEQDHESKLAAKRQLLGRTCESYADIEVNDHYIESNLFADPALTRPLFAASEFSHLSEDQMGQIVRDYNAAIEGCSQPNLKRLAMSGLFQRPFQLCGDDFVQFYGKPICLLTFYQMDLLRHGAHFRHLLSTHDISAFPKHVQTDPDLLADYAKAVESGKQDLVAKGANEPGAMVLGMKQEDARALGVSVSNPLEEAKKYNGNLLEMLAAKQRAAGG